MGRSWDSILPRLGKRALITLAAGPCLPLPCLVAFAFTRVFTLASDTAKSFS